MGPENKTKPNKNRNEKASKNHFTEEEIQISEIQAVQPHWLGKMYAFDVSYG